MIEFQGVSKSYEGALILPRLDLTIKGGHTTVLIGPSGCGKSTLLRILIGLVEPDSGRVLIDQAELTPVTRNDIRRGLGYVIQEGGLFPHLTSRENAALMARYLGWTDDRIETRLTELAELTRFPTEGLNRFPAQLSGGQKQRVSLMRALMLDPKVILLDEPLGALDPMVRADLQVDLREIFRTLEKTVILVTHDIGEAGWFGDEILLMRSGRIVQRGPINELIHSPSEPFVHQFIQTQRRMFDDMMGVH